MTTPFERAEAGERDQGAPPSERPLARIKQFRERYGGVVRADDDFLVRALPGGTEVWRYVSGSTEWLELVEVRP